MNPEEITNQIESQTVTPLKVTNETCIHNTDGVALSAYFPEGTTKEEALQWFKNADSNDYPLAASVWDDDFFGDEPSITERETIGNVTCFQFP